MKRNTEDHRKELRFLIDEMRTQYGFMIYKSDEDSLVDTESLCPSDFATAVLAAEGMSVDENLQLYRSVRNAFTEKFGGHWGSGGWPRD